MLRRLFNLTGGFLENYHSVSNGNTMAATPYTYGTAASGSTLDTLENTPLVILWGHNPNETIFGHSNHYFQKMKKTAPNLLSLIRAIPIPPLRWRISGSRCCRPPTTR